MTLIHVMLINWNLVKTLKSTKTEKLKDQFGGLLCLLGILGLGYTILNQIKYQFTNFESF